MVLGIAQGKRKSHIAWDDALKVGLEHVVNVKAEKVFSEIVKSAKTPERAKKLKTKKDQILRHIKENLRQGGNEERTIKHFIRSDLPMIML